MATTSPEAIRRGLLLLSDEALRDFEAAVRRVGPDGARDLLLAAGPGAMDYYAGGSAALAADWYEELREAAAPARPFTVTAPAWQQEERFARALVWATEPLQLDDPDLAASLSRLGSAVQYETFEAFTGSADANLRDDTEAVGWMRNANYAACKFCKMLADRGAVYRKRESVQFAAHTSCQCTIVPAFKGGDHGPEASVIQYTASKRRVTDKDRTRIRAYLNEHFPDAPG